MKKIIGIIMVGILLIISACSNTTEDASKSNDKNSGNTDFPDKPITMLVPFAPGSLNDNAARALSQQAEKNLPNNQPIKIENVEGGGGIIGFTQLMNAKPDGYVVAYGTVSHVSVLPHLGEATFTHDSFQPIMKNTASFPLLMVRTDAPYDNFDEWLEIYGKEESKEFSYATTGPGSISNLNMVNLSKEVDAKTKNVVYEGGSQGITALLGNNIDGAVVMPSDALEHIEAGTLKPIFEFAEETDYEDAKSLADLNIPQGIEAFSMLFAPKEIPETELNILHEAFKKAHESDEYQKYIVDTNTASYYLGPEEAQENATATHKLVGELLKDLELIE